MIQPTNETLLKIKLYPEWFVYYYIIIGLVFHLPIIITSMFFSVGGKLIGIFLLVIFVYFILKITLSEISFNENDISYRNVFKRYSMSWAEVQTYGATYSSMFSWSFLFPEDMDKTVKVGIKNICISKDKFSNLGMVLPIIFPSMSSKIVYFPYRQDAYFLIQKKLNQLK